MQVGGICSKPPILMGHILTHRYATLFRKQGLKRLFSFIYDLHLTKKWSELGSFMVWETLHRLKLFPQGSYLKFAQGASIQLEKQSVSSSDFSDKITDFFESRGLSADPTVHNWKLLFIKEDQQVLGCLYPDDRNLYRGTADGALVELIARFPAQIKAIFVSSKNTIFVCVKGAVYRSTDGGSSFEKSLDLGSSVSFFRHNNEMTETPQGALIIGEYGNIWEQNGWRKLAYLYFSSDDGASWVRSDFLIKGGTNKHVHIVKYSRLLEKVFMADGDNYKKLWVSDALHADELQAAENWRAVNRFHIQMGGYTSVIEDDHKVLFGTDYQGGTNFLVETSDGEKFDKRIVPDPYRRSPIDNMVQRKSPHGNEIWANLPFSTPNSRCLLMYTKDGGQTWNKVIEYSRATHKVWLISTAKDIANEIYLSIEDTRLNERVVYRVNDLH